MAGMRAIVEREETGETAAEQGGSGAVEELSACGVDGFGASEGVEIRNGSRYEFRVDDWSGYLRAVRGRAPATIERYRFLVGQLLAELDGPAAVTRATIERHLQRLYLTGRGPSARRVALVAIRSYCEWLTGHGMLAANPAAALRGPRAYRREKPHLSVGEVRKLVWGDQRAGRPREVLELRNRVLLGVTYVAGLRASEPGGLRVEGLLWDERRETFSVLVEGRKGAGCDVRLRLNRSVSRLVGAYLPLRDRIMPGVPWLFPVMKRVQPMSRATVEEVFKRRLTEAGIERRGRRLSVHCLRHSICTHLLEAGWPIKAVQAHMGHASLETTGEYLHTADEKIARAFDKRDPLHERRRMPEVRGGLDLLMKELGQRLGPASQ